MYLRVACFCAAFLAVAAVSLDRTQHMHMLNAVKENPLEHFKQWVVKHSKSYAEDLEEFKTRFAIWMDNLEYVLEYNAKHTSHWLGMNALADLTHEEYRTKLGFNNAARKNLLSSKRKGSFKYANVSEDSLPPAIDWRKLNAVSEVKNQLQCGSCWAFSTTGSVEGINAIVTKSLSSLSEQELVDCDSVEDKGCQGGLMDYAFEFIVQNGGIDTEDDYPYLAAQGECDANRVRRKVVTIDGYEDVPENSEVALKKAVAHQPVSVAIEADQKEFQLYQGGVFDDETCGTNLDHGVLAVGYGVEKGSPYWIVKNSWGAEWGDSGYIKLKRGVSAPEGLCGIAMAASYPLKTGPNPPPSPPSPPKPAPPGPQPVQCDTLHECPPSTTCCCVSEMFGVCLSWGCCPMAKAVCCDDHEHCCPHDLPVCDTASSRCLPKPGSFASSVPMSSKVPSTFRFPWSKWMGKCQHARVH